MGWKNLRLLESTLFPEKGCCEAISSRGGSCRGGPTHPQRLGRGATLPRCHLPQTPPLPQSTSALNPPVTHRFLRRGVLFEGHPIEEAKRGGGHADRNYPQLLFVGQVDLIGTNLFRSQQLWGLGEVPCKSG